jgi:hypothetical protein
MSNLITLASGQINTTEALTIELVEADQTPAVVIITWPTKLSVLHLHRFTDLAASIARLFADAAEFGGSGGWTSPAAAAEPASAAQKRYRRPMTTRRIDKS